MRELSSSWRWCIRLGAALTFVAILGASCGGDDDEPELSPDEAVERLHAALLSPDDLPGTGWTLAGNDDFLSPENLAPDSACDPLRSWFAMFPEEPIARAQRSLEGDPGPDVEIELMAFRNTEMAADILAAARELTGEAIAACFTETLKRLRLDSTAKVTLSAATAAAPRGGIAYADDRDFAIRGTRVIAHAEKYTWTQSNIFITVDVISAGLDTTELVTTVLQRVSDSVDEVLGPD